MTPEMAQAWLAPVSNGRNRKASLAKVAALVKSFTQAPDSLGTTAIKIAADGTLIDGQHRLLALCQLGVSKDFVVIRGAMRRDGRKNRRK